MDGWSTFAQASIPPLIIDIFPPLVPGARFKEPRSFAYITAVCLTLALPLHPRHALTHRQILTS